MRRQKAQEEYITHCPGQLTDSWQPHATGKLPASQPGALLCLTTAPPRAVPSSLVRMMPLSCTVSLNSLACRGAGRGCMGALSWVAGRLGSIPALHAHGLQPHSASHPAHMPQAHGKRAGM